MASALWSSNIFDYLEDNASFSYDPCQDFQATTWLCHRSSSSPKARGKMRKHSTQAAGDRVSRSQRPKVSDHSRKRTAIACTRCRKRKIKCSGAEAGKRCETCHNADEECVTDRVGQIIPLHIESHIDSLQEVEMSPGSGLLTPASSNRNGSVASATSNTSGLSQPGPFEYAPLGYVDTRHQGSFYGRPNVPQSMPVSYYHPQINHYQQDRVMTMPSVAPHHGILSSPYTTLPPLRGEGPFSTDQYGLDPGRALPTINERHHVSGHGPVNQSTGASQRGPQSFRHHDPSLRYDHQQASTTSQTTPDVGPVVQDPSTCTASSNRKTSNPGTNSRQLATPQSSVRIDNSGHMPSPTDAVLMHPRRASGYTTAPYPTHSNISMNNHRKDSTAAAQGVAPAYHSDHATYPTAQPYPTTHRSASYNTNSHAGQYVPYYYYDPRNNSGRQHSHSTQPFGPPATTQENAYPIPGQAGTTATAASQRQTEGRQHQQSLGTKTGNGESRVQ